MNLTRNLYKSKLKRKASHSKLQLSNKSKISHKFINNINNKNTPIIFKILGRKTLLRFAN